MMAPTISSAAVKQALVQAGGSVTGAARTLGIASASLRRLVRGYPLLADAVFEQIEQEIDAAHQMLWDGLDSDSAMTRMRTAAYVLRHTEAGRRRGWGRRRMPCRETREPQDVTLKWIDT
jgi:plasmid maintenance system antidote protein VapI